VATIQWRGTNISATPIKQLENGDWLMRANQHGSRFAVGSQLRVQQNEIVEMAAAEMPPSAVAESAAALTQAMAEERKTLPTVQEVLATAAAKPAASTAPQDQDMTSKLAGLAGLAKTVAVNVEAKAAETSDRLTKAQAGAAVAIDKLNTVAAGVESSTSALEDVVNQLTNGGPPLDH
jgi:hypothetical protein